MDKDQPQKKRSAPPAKGLKFLTWPEVEALDRHIATVCEAGYGQVVITIERSVPLLISPRPSFKLSPVG